MLHEWDHLPVEMQSAKPDALWVAEHAEDEDQTLFHHDGAPLARAPCFVRISSALSGLTNGRLRKRKATTAEASFISLNLHSAKIAPFYGTSKSNGFRLVVGRLWPRDDFFI